MTGLPLISIALCTCNGSRFLPQQLDSLLSQTYSNIEVIASDDCSSDDTLAVLTQYARRDPRIKVAANTQNLGFMRNFERALRMCRGAYIAPCDQDDVWSANKLDALMAVMGSRSLAYCDSLLVDDRGEPSGVRMSQIVPMLTTDDPVVFAFGNCVSGHAMLFQRELLDRALPTPQGFFYDWWIAAVAASAGGVGYCPQPLVLYRQHGANVTDGRLSEMLAEAGVATRRQGAIASGQTDAFRRSRGYKLRYLRETEQRLAALAQLPGRHQPLIARLHRLWSERERQWLSPSLGWFMVHRRDRLLSITKFSQKRQRRYCRQFFWGVRLKQLTDKEGYAPE